MTKIKGYCPLGCGETLFLGVGGYVTCGYLECPRPDAVSTLLEDRETEHIVTFRDDGGFTMRHPLRERLDDALLRCQAHDFIVTSGGPGPTKSLARKMMDEGQVTFHMTFRENSAHWSAPLDGTS